MYVDIKTRLKQVCFDGTLKARVFRGGAWLASGSLAEQSTRFLRNIILVRLLAPDAFGTMAVVLSVSSAVQSFTEIGVREGLIQNPRGREPAYINAAWWISSSRALFIYALLFTIAPWAGTFYGNSEICALLRMAALSLIFEGAISANAYVAIKQMRFRSWALVYHGGGILGVVTTVVLSLFLRNVWALAVGACLESVFRFGLSYVVCPFVPSVQLHREALRDLLKFSRGLLGLSFLNLMFMRTDIFLLAKLYPASQLGVYSMAVYLVQVPTGFLVNVLVQVLLPTYSHIQADKLRTNRILLQITKSIVLLGLPTLIFILLYGRSLLSLIYGERYVSAAAALGIATAVALINMLNTQITAIFYASAKPTLHRRCVAVMAAITVALTYPLARWIGLAGAQVACLAAMTTGFLLQLERMRHVTGLQLTSYFRQFALPSVASTVVVMVFLATRTVVPSASPVIGIVFGTFGYLVSCCAAALFLLRRSAVSTWPKFSPGTAASVLQSTSPNAE